MKPERHTEKQNKKETHIQCEPPVSGINVKHTLQAMQN
jgi:hypothetical protein